MAQQKRAMPHTAHLSNGAKVEFFTDPGSRGPVDA